MGRYLLTGGAGFIGGAVADSLVGQGHEVVVVDNLSTGFRSAVPEEARLIVGDCQSQETLEQVPSVRYDAIYHIAGQSSGEISFDDPVYDLQTNAQSTLLLLELAVELECPRFLYASTMSVYGNQGDDPVGEETTPSPKSFYGVGKLASEHYMRLYSQYGVDTCALRLFNVYGPGQNMENLRQGMVSIFLAQAIEDRHIHVKGSRDRYRDFVFVDDVVKAFRVAESEAPEGFSVFNVGTGTKTRVGDLVNLIVDHLPFAASVRYAGSTPGDQFGIVADVERAQEELGWTAELDLEAGMQQMIDWALE